jgi:hypothetical protein
MIWRISLLVAVLSTIALACIDVTLVAAGDGLPPAQVHQMFVAVAGGGWLGALTTYCVQDARRQAFADGYGAGLADHAAAGGAPKGRLFPHNGGR